MGYEFGRHQRTQIARAILEGGDTRVLAGLGMVEGEPASEEWLRDTARWFSPDDVAVGLAKLSCMFEVHDVDAPATQVEVARTALRPPEFADKVAAKLADGGIPRIWFSSLQAMYGLRLLAEMNREAPYGAGDSVETSLLSRWLLGLCDAIGRTYGETGIEQLSNPLNVARWDIANWYANRVPAKFATFARTAGLLAEASALRNSSGASPLDIAAEAQQHLGISLTKYLSFLALIYSSIVSTPRHEVVLEIDPSVWTSTLLTVEEIETCLQRVSMGYDDLRRLLAASASVAGTGPLNTLPFRKKPLLRTKNGKFICPSIALFETHMIDGLYYTLRDKYRGVGGANANPFSVFWGYVVEAYVRRLIEAVVPADGIQKRAWFDDGKNKYNRGQDSPPDVFLSCAPRGVIFFEVGSSRLSVPATCRGDIPAIESDLDRCILSKAAQLDRYIRDYSSGRLSFEGHVRDSHESIVPVVVTFDYSPQFAGVREYVSPRIEEKSQHLTENKRILPLQVLCLEELEHLLALADDHGGIWQILIDKICAERGKVAKSFASHFHSQHMAAEACDHSYLARVLDDMFNEIAECAFGQPLASRISRDHRAGM